MYQVYWLFYKISLRTFATGTLCCRVGRITNMLPNYRPDGLCCFVAAVGRLTNGYQYFVPVALMFALCIFFSGSPTHHSPLTSSPLSPIPRRRNSCKWPSV